MKALVVALCSMAVAAVCSGRLVPLWTPEKFMAESDLVAEVRFSDIRISDDILQGHGDPKKFLAYRARIEVQTLRKSSSDEASRELVFFTYAPAKMIEGNGALFLSPAALAEGVWLVYLKESAPGVYVPTTDHYDASLAVRKVEAK